MKTLKIVTLVFLVSTKNRKFQLMIANIVKDHRF